MSTETELQVAVKTSAKKDSRKKGRADFVPLCKAALLCSDKVNSRIIQKQSDATGVIFMVTVPSYFDGCYSLVNPKEFL